MTETAVSVIDSKWNEFSRAVAERETCDINCPLFNTCPMTIYAPECLVNVMREEDQRKLMLIFFLGEDGFKTEILLTLFKLSQNLNMKDSRDLERYLDALVRVHKQIYSQKVKPVAPMVPVQIVMGEAAPKREEKPVVILQESDFTQEPESLFNSPELDKIVRKDGNSRSKAS